MKMRRRARRCRNRLVTFPWPHHAPLISGNADRGLSTMNPALRKQRTKQVVRRLIGEPYVGKRLKMRRLDHVLTATDLHPSSILDAGTEDGTFVYWLADRYPGATVTAIDIDTRAIAACEAARPARYAGRVNFRAAHFGELDPESFDLIAAFDVLEHIR